MYAFNILQPETVESAVEALASEDAQALSGGQTLIPTLKQRLAAPSSLVSLSNIDALKGISVNGSAVTIGAGTVHADVSRELSGTFPALAQLAGAIGDPAVRNRGTIGGSVANNDPSADYPAGVLGAGATIVTNTREIAADAFFEGLFQTALEDGEIITSVVFDIPKRAAYQKFDQPASRFALVGVFVAATEGGVRVAVTGASEDGVFRWTEAEAALNASFTPEALAELTVSSDGMITDLHGTGAYRANLVKVLTKRAVQSIGSA